MLQQYTDSEEMLKFLMKFCSVKTVNGVQNCENNGAQFLYDSLCDLDYFKSNPECLFLQSVEGDTLSRHNLAAFLKSTLPTKKTIILSGHIDTVDTEVCGALKGLAFNPEAYTSALLKSDLPNEIQKELSSGEYLAGRGIADMKGGLAAQREIIRYYAEHREQLTVNLLWMPVIDEENNANGIHQAVKYFSSLQDEGYEMVCCIDSEPTITPESKQCGRIFLGTIGMVTPFALAVGKESHVGEYYEGISAALMAFYLGIAAENNPLFTESYKGKKYPPICCLQTTDFRKSYSVTIPDRFAMYFNYLFVEKRPVEIMDILMELSKESAQKALAQIGKEDAKVNIITFQDLCGIYAKKTGDNPEKILSDLIKKYTGKMEIQDICLNYINKISEIADIKGPAFVIGFLPPYCPSRVNHRESILEKKIESVVRNLIDAQAENGVKIELSEVYEGISDLSELGFQGTSEDIDLLQKNLVGLNAWTPYNFELMQKLNVPVVNIGPIGKDAHKSTERINLPYFKNVLTGLLFDFIEGLTTAISEKDGIN